MKLLVIDNYDSFTYNLVHLIGELGPELDVARNDQITTDEIALKRPDAIILSPGPCTPNEAGICLEVVEKFHKDIPIFGVCLGMQSIGQAFGGEVVLAPNMMHGKVSTISNTGQGVFHGLNKSFEATRYHSLMMLENNLPNHLQITAHADDDGSIMGIQHKTYPVHGVQFHPESIASENGHALLKNFLNIVEQFHIGRAA